MRTIFRTALAVVLGTVAFAVTGCSGQKAQEETQPAAQQAAPPSGEAAGHEVAGAPVTPAGSLHEIWTQIAEEQARLSATIQNGQLKDVHHLAFGIRDLVVAFADKASASYPAVAPELKNLVEQVKTSAGKLDELGDAGNLGGTQAEFVKFEKLLATIKSVTDTH
ncbi:MAG TPA: hypothetical protein VFG76_09450 [Candidatus Polarisedimenticolia bacterium]|nr:hypothetical protein [Candidatus Polarisedimenticolia bacterium]